MEDSEKYIKKRWNLEQMKIRVENLKKVISAQVVDDAIRIAKYTTDDELDGLYIAYYRLKDEYSKIKRRWFGFPKLVDYKSRFKYIIPKPSSTVGFDPSEYTWTVESPTRLIVNTTSIYDIATTTAYNNAAYYNLNDNYNTVSLYDTTNGTIGIRMNG